MTKLMFGSLLALVLCGCFKTKDELTINADGSGSVRIETRLLVPGESLQALGMNIRMDNTEGAPAIYPPTSEAEARRWFPPKNFTLTTREDRTDEGGSVLVITAGFKDVNVLLASAYGKAHGLTLQLTNGVLAFKAVSAIEPAARISEMKDEGGMFGDMMAPMEMLTRKKNQMRSEFRVTLPNAASSSSPGATREGRSVTWINDRAGQTNADEFVRRAGAMLEATCDAQGLKFSPVTPARLSLLPFSEVPAGLVGEKGVTPDTNQVVAAARFVPLALQVRRSIDLSGEAGTAPSRALLAGTMVLPGNLAPHQWGEPRLDEVVDGRGHSLKFEKGAEEDPMTRFFGGRGDDGDDDGENDERPGDSRRTVTLAFQPPDRQVREIARLKGGIPVHYFAGARIVKLSNAIPENWIRVMKGREDFDFDTTPRAINDAGLAGLGFSLNLMMGMAQGAMTTLMLQADGGRLSVSEAQVYDTQGRPWPTILQKQSVGPGEEGAIMLMVGGRPTGPLSLALVVSGVGASVDLPIVAEKLAIGAK